MRKFLAVVRSRLIAEWRDAWRYVSVQLNGAGLGLLGLVGIINETWNSMPPELRHALPFAQYLAYGLFAAGIAARFVRQPRTAEKIQAKQEERNG